MNTGVRQGYVLFLLLNCFVDRVLKEGTETLGGGLGRHNIPRARLPLAAVMVVPLT